MEYHWTEAQKVSARRLFHNGKSAKEIAEKFGRSRSAVLGMLHRAGALGLPKSEIRRRRVIAGKRVWTKERCEEHGRFMRLYWAKRRRSS